MPEPRVVHHRAEDVDVGGLRLEIDRQLLEPRAIHVLVAPRVVEGAQQRRRARGVDDGAELTDPVGEDIQPPADPGLAMCREEERRALGRRHVGQLDRRGVLEAPQASIAEAGVRHVRLGLLPTRVAVVVVEPHAVDREVLQQFPVRVHAKPAVAVVGRADTLPPLRRRRDPAVGADRGRVGVLLQVFGHVKRVELGIHLHALGAKQRQPLRREAPRIPATPRRCRNRAGVCPCRESPAARRRRCPGAAATMGRRPAATTG